jgi:hypothetical protein
LIRRAIFLNRSTIVALGFIGLLFKRSHQEGISTSVGFGKCGRSKGCGTDLSPVHVDTRTKDVHDLGTAINRLFFRIDDGVRLLREVLW